MIILPPFLRRIALSASLSVLSMQLSAQWSVGVQLTPAAGYRSLMEYQPNSVTGPLIQQRNVREVPAFSFKSGLTVAWHFSENWSLQSGVSYARYRYKVPIEQPIYEDQITTGDSFVNSVYEPSAMVAEALIIGAQYLEVPVNLVYTSSAKSWAFRAVLGVVPAYEMQTFATMKWRSTSGGMGYEVYSMSEIYNINVKRFQLSVNAEAGVQYSRNAWSVYACPIFSAGLLHTLEAPISQKLWMTGMHVGISTTLKRKSRKIINHAW